MKRFELIIQLLGHLVDIGVYLVGAIFFVLGLMALIQQGKIAEALAIFGGITTLFCKVDHESKRLREIIKEASNGTFIRR